MILVKLANYESCYENIVKFKSEEIFWQLRVE